MVALLFVGANILLGQAMEDQRKAALAVHLTDRQFSLSQRIAWLGNLYAERGDADVRQQLQSAITEMATTAENLRTGHRCKLARQRWRHEQFPAFA